MSAIADAGAAIAAATRELTFGQFVDAVDFAVRDRFGEKMAYLVNVEQLRLLREVHAAIVGKEPVGKVKAALDGMEVIFARR